MGIAGDFHGLARLDADGMPTEYIEFTRTAGGSTIAPEEHFTPEEAVQQQGDNWTTAAEESTLLAEMGQVHDEELF